MTCVELTVLSCSSPLGRLLGFMYLLNIANYTPEVTFPRSVFTSPVAKPDQRIGTARSTKSQHPYYKLNHNPPVSFS